MRPVSAAFLRTIKGSHTMLARATVCTTFQSGVTPTGTRIPILDGDVILDGTADIRATLDLSTSGNNTWPVSTTSLFVPYGNEIYVERGVQYSDEQVEYCGLGYFRIQAPEQAQAPWGPIRITARDRMAGIIDARLLAPVQFAAGTTLATIVATLVQAVYPLATIEWDDATSTHTIIRSVQVVDDRYGFLNDLVVAQGKTWHWDHRGMLVIQSLPNPAQPVWEIAAGAGGALLSLSRHLSRDGVYNAVVASGEAVDELSPARGVAIDANPTSPTYFYGRFGPVPRFYTSPFLATNDQATSAAQSLLRRSLGLPYSLDLSAVANPALEPWDPVTLRSDDNERTEVHVLERITIPLLAGVALTASTREQSVTLFGSV